MPLEHFQNVLNQLQGKTKNIALHVWGDPLTIPNLQEYLDLVLKTSLKVRLVTNGIHLGANQKSILTHKALLQCAISLNSAEQLSLSKQKAYLANIFEWCEYHVQNRLNTFVNLRLWKKQDEDSKFIDWILSEINSNFNLQIPNNFNYSTSYQLAPKIRFVGSRYFAWPDFNAPIVPQSTCHGLRSQLGILSDLRVVPCCMDGDGVMELGNLSSQSLDEILSSPRALKIKNGFEKNRTIEPFCCHCGFRERFITRNLQ